jgi:hypothetical protein
MASAAYRVGQVAKLLGVSGHHIRKLCEAGLVQAEVSDGGQWRLPVGEVQRLQAQGVPPVPSVDTPQDATHKPPLRKTLDDEEPVGTGSPEVLAERASVEIAAARLQRRKIELETEEVEDAFRAREATSVAEAQRVRAEQNRQLMEAARIEWRNRWLKYAQDKIPYGASPSVRLQVHDAIEAVLNNKLSVNVSSDVITRVVDATVAIALEPYHRARQREGIIDKIIPRLPADFYWHLRSVDTGLDDIKQIAREAIEALSPTATEAQMKSAASRALQPLAAAFQHDEAKRRLLADMSSWRWLARERATDDERSAATEAVKQALDKCAPTATVAELEKVKPQVLATFDQKIEQRVQAKRRREQAEDETDRALRHVTAHLNAEYEFDSPQERWEDEDKLRSALRPILFAQFVEGKFSVAHDAHRFIEKYIDQHIRLEESDENSSRSARERGKRT